MGQRPFIVVGDRTDHGGTVVEGSGITDTHGKAIARVGDQVTCPIPGHGATIITSGDNTMIIDGKPAARHLDKCACGATLIASQFVSSTSDGGASNPQAASNEQKAKAASAGVFARYTSEVSNDEGIEVVEELDHAQNAGEFDQRFLLHDVNGQPIANMAYRILLDSGITVEGRSDAEGLTQPVSSSSSETALLEVFQEEPSLMLNWDA